MARTKQMSKARCACQFITQPSVFNLEPAHPPGLIHNVQDFSLIQWLFKKTISSALHGLERSAFGIAAGNDHYLQRRILRAGHIDQREPLGNIDNAGRQMKIANYDIDRLGIDERSSLVAGRSLKDLVIRSK